MTALAGGGLVLGFNWFSAEAAPKMVSNAAAGGIEFNSYLSIATDGTITIMSPNPELGQNIMTSFPMVVAEELEADWKKVNVLRVIWITDTTVSLPGVAGQFHSFLEVTEECRGDSKIHAD